MNTVEKRFLMKLVTAAQPVRRKVLKRVFCSEYSREVFDATIDSLIVTGMIKVSRRPWVRDDDDHDDEERDSRFVFLESYDINRHGFGNDFSD